VSQQCIMPKQYMQNSVTNNKIEQNNCSRYNKQMKNPSNPRCSYGKYFPKQTMYFTRCNCHINHISQINHKSYRKSSLFCDVMQHRLVVIYWYFRTTYQFHLRGSSRPLTLEDGPMDSLKTLVTTTLCHVTTQTSEDLNCTAVEAW
jgi:hypothetical protein